MAEALDRFIRFAMDECHLADRTPLSQFTGISLQ